MNKVFSAIVVALAFFFLPLTAALAQTDPLPSWNDGLLVGTRPGKIGGAARKWKAVAICPYLTTFARVVRARPTASWARARMRGTLSRTRS